MKRMTVLALAASVFALGLTGCTGGTVGSGYTIISTAEDPGFQLHHDWGPGILIENGPHGNSCIFADSDVAGRRDICRVLDGIEGYGVNDPGNWLITPSDPINGERPIKVTGSNAAPYGHTITYDGGSEFEGCWWRSPDNSFLCDYRVRKQVVANPHAAGGWDYFLRKAWNWDRYVLNTAECAGGIHALIVGQARVSAFLLNTCLDGPMDTPHITDGNPPPEPSGPVVWPPVGSSPLPTHT